MINKIKNSEAFKPIVACGLVLCLLLALFTLSSRGQINVASPTPAYTVITNVGTNLTYNLLYTNAAKIARVQIAAGPTTAIIDVYDSSTSNFFVTNGVYTTTTNYTSNVVTTSISSLTGITNIETNLVYVTATNIVAANTNVPQYRTFIAPANSLATYDVNMLNSRGIAFRSASNLPTTTVLITYRPND